MDIEQLPDFPILRQVRDALYEAGPVSGAAVMVGAGFSQFCQLATATTKRPPLWWDLRDTMVRDLYPADADRAPQDPLALAQEYEATLGSHGLINLIRTMVPDAEWAPGPLHRDLLDLPWTDVLTTNWDTLLERTASNDADLSYSVVRVKSEIARAKRPRIVKLHGTLIDYEPFIFTEDHFRTYPTKFAPFVNLAQQVLLENELCLIGFSGSDPNFLQWSGWVRDQLGDNARPIRLIGVLDLPASKRKVLEDRKITPIDLSPLVKDEPREYRHLKATKRLLEFLQAGRPSQRPTWVRVERLKTSLDKATTADEKIACIAAMLAQNRRSRPDWVVTPYFERERARQELVENILPVLEQHIEDALPENRAKALFEFLWQCRTVFLRSSERIERLVEKLIDSGEDRTIDTESRVLLHVANVREARRRRDWLLFDRRIADLEKLDPASGCKLEAAYERLLKAKHELDWETILALEDQLIGDDPLWHLRRAAIVAEIHDTKAALSCVSQGLDLIRRRRAQDRKSLWLLAREGWASWLSHADHDKRRETRRDREWPLDYRAADADPWDELHRLDEILEAEADHQRRAARGRVAQFDAGAYTQWTYHRGKSTAAPRHQIIEFAEIVGIPSQIGHTLLLRDRMVRAAELERQSNGMDIRDELWLAVVCDHSYIDKALTPLAIARLPPPTIDELIATVRRAIDFSRPRVHGPDRETSSDWCSRLGALLEILSRLAVRTRGDIAIGLFRFAAELLKDHSLTDWDIHERLGNLLRRSIKAIEPERRKEIALEVLQLPLPAEKGKSAADHRFPDVTESLSHRTWAVRDSNPAWDVRIADLLRYLGQQDQPRTRWAAAHRLVTLFEAGSLREDEIREFGVELWLFRSPNGLPADTGLLEHVFLYLPGPGKDYTFARFVETVVKPLTEGKINLDRVQSLSGISYNLQGKYALSPIDPHDALLIFDHFLRWKRPSDDANSVLRRNSRALALAIPRALVATIVPSLNRNDFAERLETLLTRADDGSFPELQYVLPLIAEMFPEEMERVNLAIERGLLSLDQRIATSALSAVFRAVRQPSPNGIVLSPDVVAEIVSICRTRRQPDLSWALEAAGLMVKSGIIDDANAFRLLKSIDLLETATSYSNMAKDEMEDGVLVRRAALRLAIALERRGFVSETMMAWVETARSDPMPEVRYPLDDDVD